MKKTTLFLLVTIVIILLFTSFKDDLVTVNKQNEKQEELIFKLIASIPEEKIIYMLYLNLVVGIKV